MGWFDGRSSSPRSYAITRRPSGSGRTSSRRSSGPSIFNLGASLNRSTSSFFSSSSSRRARPRSGFIQRMIHRIKRLFKDIYYYACRHPMKVFLMVIMPLLTGGVLQKLLATVGVSLPRGLTNSLPGGSRGLGGEFGAAGGSGLGQSVNSLMSVAKMFM